MNNAANSKLRVFVKLYRWYQATIGVVGIIAVAYLVLLNFPQPLFAHSAEYKGFNVYSREEIGIEMNTVLDRAETRLKASPIYDEAVRRDVYLTGSFGMYTFLSHKAYNGFGNSVPFVNNIFINKADAANDLVFMNREKNNSRSLSGVIAHEVAHILIRRRYGTLQSMTFPTWKTEGYCEYVAGDSTIRLEEGLRLWRESPADDTGYRYTKYHAMVKHLIEQQNLTPDDIFNRSLDQKQVEEDTLTAAED